MLIKINMVVSIIAVLQHQKCLAGQSKDVMYFCMAAVALSSQCSAPLFPLTLSAFSDRTFGELCPDTDLHFFAGNRWIFFSKILGYLINSYGQKCSSPCCSLCIGVFRNVAPVSGRLDSNADSFITDLVISNMQFWHVRVFASHSLLGGMNW